MAIGTALATVFGASKAANAAKDAASTQAAAANNATAEQRRQYDQTREDYLPFLQTGTSANTEMARLLGLSGDAGSEGYGQLAKPFTMADYQADPGYQFRLAEGKKALDRAASAGGKYFSGGAIKGLIDYNQDSASKEYQNAYDRYNANQTNLYNRLAGASGTGQTAASGLSAAGQNSANNISNNITGAGNAQAAGQVGAANAWSTGLNNFGNNLIYSSAMNRGTPSFGYGEYDETLPWKYQ